MKKVISSIIAPNQKFLSLGLLILRVLVGITMLTHGLAKLTSFSELSATFPDPIGLGSTLSLILIIGAEVGCSLFVIVGAFTRLAVIPLVFYILLFFTGAGRISLDTIISKKIDVGIQK